MGEAEPVRVELAAAIGQVREQLAKAIDEGKDSPVAFRAGPVELEFEVVFTASGGGDVGVRVWVVSVGAKGEVSRAVTNRLKVTLTPVDRAGKDKLIGDVGNKDISAR
jgi:Trypsin-co-occurring domain 2